MFDISGNSSNGAGPEQLTFETTGGLALAAHWHKAPDARGVLVVVHGLGDHGGRYAGLAHVLSQQRRFLHVLTYDQRGHGRSPGQRGVAESYEVLLDELQVALQVARNRAGDLPLYALGHSNGGQVLLRLLEREPRAVDGILLSNPALRIIAPISPIQWIGGHLLAWISPNTTLGGGISQEWLTRDRQRQLLRSEDELMHTCVQPRLLLAMMEGGTRILSRMFRLEVPVFLVLGMADPLIDAKATERWFRRLDAPSKVLLKLEDGVHEPLEDLERDLVIERIATWLDQQLNPAEETRS